MRDAKSNWKSAFTLIELLIVVAIIAILAAIAVPNFLEAQTRAKVSRAKADQRSLATAIESYSVDWNMPPLGAWSLGPACSCVGWWVDGPQNAKAQAQLTTPVAYITDIMDDPFKTRGTINLKTDAAGRGARYFNYQDYRNPAMVKLALGKVNNAWVICWKKGFTWSLWSAGPMRVSNGAIQDILRGVVDTTPWSTDSVYDPSNGTISLGWVIRTNKGVFTGP